jgi:hypothetical protein
MNFFFLTEKRRLDAGDISLAASPATYELYIFNGDVDETRTSVPTIVEFVTFVRLELHERELA